jgi:chromosome partitioning protein
MDPKLISLFNHKGGASKTTTAFNLGWALADSGLDVLLVDADPQCNLTGMALELSGIDELESFYTENPNSNIYAALQPAFAGTPATLKSATPSSTKHPRLKLLAGHIDVALYEPELAMAHKLTTAMPVLQNLPAHLATWFDKPRKNTSVLSF